jgi:soluble lytic murein transglycosylase-like protein
MVQIRPLADAPTNLTDRRIEAPIKPPAIAETKPAIIAAPQIKTPAQPPVPVVAKIAAVSSATTLAQIAVLSSDDEARYKQIFAAQKKGRWSEAGKLIAKLENKLLLGHVKFQRYMHPTAYRSKFSELQAWMRDYKDHPEAARIYKLANRRKPSAAGAPKRPERKSWRFANRERTAFEVYNPKRTTKQKRHVARVGRYVRSLLKRERPTQALNYLNQPKIRNSLTTIEFDRFRHRVAVSYYMEQVDAKAYKLASEIARRSRKGVPHTDWIAGLASWRLGNHAQAGSHFEHLAKAEYVNEWDHSSSAFWAARAFLRTRQSDKVLPMLRIAAKSELSFYGILARRQLGLPVIPEWQLPGAEDRSLQEVLAAPHARRAVALAQVGELPRAEMELAWAQGLLEDRHDAALMRVASALGLASVEYKIALSTDAKGLEAGLYPVPTFTPRGGYKVDRPLLFAIMRKESKFLANAESHAGARGLMQIMPITAEHVTGDRRYRHSKVLLEELFEPEVNIDLGQTYIKGLMGSMKPKGNLMKFLAAYNAGPGNLNRWLRNVKFQDDPLLFVESLPVPETRSYVEKVLASYWIYRARLGHKIPSLDAVIEGAWPVYMRQEKGPGDVAALTSSH